MTAEANRIADARLIASLLAIDPGGLGGLWLRVRSREIQGDIKRLLTALPRPLHGFSPTTDDIALFGGTDLAASLTSGRLVASEGLVERHPCLWLSQAQDADAGLSARLCGALDAGRTVCLILADEAAEADCRPHDGMCDRLAFFFHDDGLPPSALAGAALDSETVRTARDRLKDVSIGEAAIGKTARTCASIGISSARIPGFVLKAARALAALEGRDSIENPDLETAARLVLGHRLPPEIMDDTTQPEVDKPSEDPPVLENTDPTILEKDILIEAAKTVLPADLLRALVSRAQTGRGQGAGAQRTSSRRGRPLPSRPGRLSSRSRPDILATLQAAAPWQKLRHAAPGHLVLHPDDIRVRRFAERSERLLIFAIDASGSAAMARLAEAKGAATGLLGNAYQSRDQVALIGFRGAQADLMVPPTRSLTRTKRLLSGMIGGGATPLAAGLKAAGELARTARKQGLTPHIILMTDGRGNCDLSGHQDRAQAKADAEGIARWIRSMGVPTLVLDSGARPSPALVHLSQCLGADCIPLLRSKGTAMHEVVQAALTT